MHIRLSLWTFNTNKLALLIPMNFLNGRGPSIPTTYSTLFWEVYPKGKVNYLEILYHPIPRALLGTMWLNIKSMEINFLTRVRLEPTLPVWYITKRDDYIYLNNHHLCFHSTFIPPIHILFSPFLSIPLQIVSCKFNCRIHCHFIVDANPALLFMWWR